MSSLVLILVVMSFDHGVSGSGGNEIVFMVDVAMMCILILLLVLMVVFSGCSFYFTVDGSHIKLKF